MYAILDFGALCSRLVLGVVLGYVLGVVLIVVIEFVFDAIPGIVLGDVLCFGQKMLIHHFSYTAAIGNKIYR